MHFRSANNSEPFGFADVLRLVFDTGALRSQFEDTP